MEHCSGLHASVEKAASQTVTLEDIRGLHVPENKYRGQKSTVCIVLLENPRRNQFLTANVSCQLEGRIQLLKQSSARTVGFNSRRFSVMKYLLAIK